MLKMWQKSWFVAMTKNNMLLNLRFYKALLNSLELSLEALLQSQ